VKELGRVRQLGLAAGQEHDDADDVVAGLDGHLLRERGGHLGGAVADAIPHVVRDLVHEARGGVRRTGADAQPWHADHHGGADRIGGEGGDGAQPLASEDGLHHLQVDGPQALDEARGRGRGGVPFWGHRPGHGLHR